MDKSFLVIDTPDRCYDCPLLKFEGMARFRCGMKSVLAMSAERAMGEKPGWCPLQGLPEPVPYSGKMETNNMNLYAAGWNDYRGRLLGSPEENIQDMDWYEGD